jgi:hypothetical protein
MKHGPFLVLIIFLSLIFSAKGMADTPLSANSSATNKLDIVEQKQLELIELQEKNAEEEHERNLANMDNAHKTHERGVQLQDEAQKTHERNLKIQDEEEANEARFAKILSTWEHQQQQYQAYLDSLKH